MGLFSTVIHLYKTSQADTISALQHGLGQLGTTAFVPIPFDAGDHPDFPELNVFGVQESSYLVTQPHNHWITILELHTGTQAVNPFALSEKISRITGTYALCFHLHDDDVLYYQLDLEGKTLDHYDSNCQYFLEAPIPRSILQQQRHSPRYFAPVLPSGKTTDGINELLNEGYWNAVDNGDLDDDGVPVQDHYFIDETRRLERLGMYLEIYAPDKYPFACWHEHLEQLTRESYLVTGNG